jgi:hypothetical protein
VNVHGWRVPALAQDVLVHVGGGGPEVNALVPQRRVQQQGDVTGREAGAGQRLPPGAHRHVRGRFVTGHRDRQVLVCCLLGRVVAPVRDRLGHVHRRGQPAADAGHKQIVEEHDPTPGKQDRTIDHFISSERENS